ncbi:nuclear transport factor 2 family protein [Mycolicibacterium sphagni]|nr:nuclear transport factor 2 family protein [Mycolicibacterium sphagni]
MPYPSDSTIRSVSAALATVEAFFEGLQNGEFASCAALFTEDAVVWNNFDQRAESSAEAMAALAALTPVRLRFTIASRDVIDEVCVQRHAVSLLAPDGRTASFPAIQRIVLQGHKIARIDEYLDRTTMQDAARAVQPGAGRLDDTLKR